MLYLRSLPSVLKKPSVIILILSNCIPIVGVLFWGWDLFSILFLYWAETAIIGFFSLMKMIVALRLKSLIIAPFFVLHFGGFMVGHLFFLIILFANPASPFGSAKEAFDIFVLLKSLVIPFIVLWLSHGSSFFVNYLNSPEEVRQKQASIGSAYGRVIVMHMTIILGSMLSFMLDHAIYSLVILIAIKIVADLISHIHQHRHVMISGESARV